jgi:hypothetical protein
MPIFIIADHKADWSATKMADIALDVLCIDTSVHVVNHTPAQSVTGCGSEPIGERRNHPYHHTAHMLIPAACGTDNGRTDEEDGADDLTRLPAARRPGSPYSVAFRPMGQQVFLDRASVPISRPHRPKSGEPPIDIPSGCVPPHQQPPNRHSARARR